MKKSSVVLLAGLLALSVGGAATASALIIATGGGYATTTEPGETDTVLYLKWGSTQSIGAVDNLTPSKPAFRSISVDAEKSPTAEKDGKFTINLGIDTASALTAGNSRSMEGLTVVVYDKPFQTSQEHDGEPGEGATLLATLDKDHVSYEEVVSVAKAYYLKISVSNEAYAKYLDEGTYKLELAAKLTFSYGVNE